MKESALYDRVRKDIQGAEALIRKNHGGAFSAGRADLYGTLPVEKTHVQYGRFLGVELKVSDREAIPCELCTTLQKADLREIARKGGVGLVVMALKDGRLLAQRAFSDGTFTGCQQTFLKDKDAVISIIRSLI